MSFGHYPMSLSLYGQSFTEKQYLSRSFKGFVLCLVADLGNGQRWPRAVHCHADKLMAGMQLFTASCLISKTIFERSWITKKKNSCLSTCQPEEEALISFEHCLITRNLDIEWSAWQFGWKARTSCVTKYCTVNSPDQKNCLIRFLHSKNKILF